MVKIIFLFIIKHRVQRKKCILHKKIKYLPTINFRKYLIHYRHYLNPHNVKIVIKFF